MSEVIEGLQGPYRLPVWQRIGVAAALVLSASCSGDTRVDQPVQSAESVTTTTPVDIVELQHEATVHIRFSEAPANKDDAYRQSVPNCSGTYIGDQWFLSAEHCFNDIVHAGARYFDQVYDEIFEFPRTITVWKGEEPAAMQMVGTVDSLVLDGNESHGDFALLHVTEKVKIPAMKVASDSSQDHNESSDNYTIAGYPEKDNFYKLQSPIDYLGQMSGAQMQDETLGTNNELMTVFGKSPFASGANEEQAILESDSICEYGMSGGSALNARTQKIIGVLSRFSRPEWDFWQTIKSYVSNLDSYKKACMFWPVSDIEVKFYKTRKGFQPDKSTIVNGK